MNNDTQNNRNQPIVPSTADNASADKPHKNKILRWIGKIFLAGCVLFISFYAGILLSLYLTVANVHPILIGIAVFLLPLLLLPLIFIQKRRQVVKWWGILAAMTIVAIVINLGIHAYDESITVDTSPNINIHEYMPFQENSKIVTLDHKASLQLTEDLPVIDGAAALFPVYSAFVHATYPETTKIYDGVFEYNNTPGGYHLLGEKRTDLFIGVYPSESQIEEAAQNNTEFVYTPIGTEAFVFFVHKENPNDSLTTEQIQAIYSGQITNWKEVGGPNEKIAAYQRNQGSGSQSMLIRFMDGKPIMDAPTEMVNDLMIGIIEQVSDYRSKSGSIGFSFRYYVEGIIQNPDIKLLSIDGVAPTVENIKNGSYPVTTPIYAVTYAGNDNPNVDRLIQWILSEEGQEIIERTGYAGIK